VADDRPTLELSPLTITDIVRYAGASGDFNPIHHDPDLAAEAGQPGVFVMGMLTAGVVTPYLEDVVEQGGVVEMRFLERVWPGHPLAVQVHRGADGAVAEVSSGGKPVLHVTARSGAETAADTPGGTSLCDPYTWVVEQGAVRAFREATRAADAPSGPSAAAPAVFAVTAQRWRNSGKDLVEQVGFDVTRMLHGSSTFELRGGPLRVGETYEVHEILTPVKEKVGRRGGRMRSVDVVTDVRSPAGELRCRATTRLLELEARTDEPAAPEHPFVRLDPPKLLGSRDDETGETYFPPRELSVDGRLRPLRTVELQATGVLHSWTELADVAYGQVDLPEGVRVQAQLNGGPHVIGDSYTFEAAPTGHGTMRWGYRHD
jgi:uncharacterized OB-fold protein